jgi:hypothetical protein
MIVSGRDPIFPGLGPEALRQLELRRRLAVYAANEYWRDGYGEWDVESLCTQLERETPRIGLWIDTSALSPEETVDQILLRRAEAHVS